MPDLVKLSNNQWLNLDQIRSLECEAVPRPACKIIWANGNTEIIRDDCALALMLVLAQRREAVEIINQELLGLE